MSGLAASAESFTRGDGVEQAANKKVKVSRNGLRKQFGNNFILGWRVSRFVSTMH